MPTPTTMLATNAVIDVKGHAGPAHETEVDRDGNQDRDEAEEADPEGAHHDPKEHQHAGERNEAGSGSGRW